MQLLDENAQLIRVWPLLCSYPLANTKLLLFAGTGGKHDREGKAPGMHSVRQDHFSYYRLFSRFQISAKPAQEPGLPGEPGRPFP